MDTEQFLNRIFSLSRRTPDRELIEVPFGLETAVLAHWRAAVSQRAASSGLLRGLRWAALMACAVALPVGAFASDELAAFNNRFDPEARVADSAIVAGYGYE